MNLVFADTVFWVARINPNDKHHQEAESAQSKVGTSLIVTTDSVFGEVFALLSGRHAIRMGAISLFRSLDSSPNVRLVRQHVGLFNRAMDRYERQGSESSSLVDCISMVVMDDYGITEVLTADADFEKAGYKRLMQNPGER